MADLQEFSKLFTALEDKVSSLTKQRDDLSQGITTLEARSSYLDGVVVQLKRDIDDLKAKKSKQAAVLQGEIDSLVARRAELDKSLSKLHTEINSGLSELADKQQATNNEVIQLNSIVADKKKTISGLIGDIKIAETALTDVQNKIMISRQELGELNKQVSHKAAEVESEVLELENTIAVVQERHRKVVSQLDDKQDDLEEMNGELATKQEELAAIDKKHQEFLEYEKRGNATLKAREDALLDKENELDTQLLRIRRRNSVLDKMS